jgi:hypothetical protein
MEVAAAFGPRQRRYQLQPMTYSRRRYPLHHAAKPGPLGKRHRSYGHPEPARVSKKLSDYEPA